MVKCSTLEELIREARLLFEVAEESKVFIQRFDELWMEKVDVEALNEVNDRDKLFLVCTEQTQTWKRRYVTLLKPTFLFFFCSGRKK